MGQDEREAATRVTELYAVAALHGVLIFQALIIVGVENGFESFGARLHASLAAMTRRLGAERFRRIDVLIAQALESQRRTGSVEGHRAWIAMLLTEYYDPMYQYQRSGKADRIVFTGDRDAVLDWLERDPENFPKE